MAASPLDAAALRRLRHVVRTLNAEGISSRAKLVELAAGLDLPAGLTIDFEASRELGEPMIVVRLPQRANPPACFDGLTARELEVAGLLAEGISNKDIARRLCISLATVKDHVHRILDKTGLTSRAEVMAALLSS